MFRKRKKGLYTSYYGGLHHTTPRPNKLISGEQPVSTLSTLGSSVSCFLPGLVTNHKVQRGATLQTLHLACLNKRELAATENISELELFCILVVYRT